MIFGSRITQAREFNNLTQVELAKAIGVAQSTLANFERNRDHPGPELVNKLGDTLNFPVSFFHHDISPYFAVGTLEFRAKSGLSAKLTKHAYQYGHIVFEFASFLAKRLTMPSMRLPRLDGDPEVAARLARSELGLSPYAPIPNIVDALEQAGVFVFALPALCEGSFDRIDGFSVWAGDGQKLIPAVFVSSSAPGDRQRLTIAHEIGELTLTDMPPGREREKKANRFAGAFLMPADSFCKELTPPFTIDDFAQAKRQFGVSIQAALMRARQLEVIDDRRYHALFQQLSARGWRKAEPAEFAIPFEKPRALYKMVELLYGTPIDLIKLGSDTNLDPWFIRQLLATHASRSELGGSQRNAKVFAFPERGAKATAADDQLKSM